jgi:hypothetical protein
VTEKCFYSRSNSKDQVEQLLLNVDIKALYKEAFDPKSNQYSQCVQLLFFTRNLERWDRRFAYHCAVPASACDSVGM